MEPRTQPLRDEHRALLPELAMLRVAADAIGTATAAEHVARSDRLLTRHLLPHMTAEEAVLYPAIDRCAEHDATATMRRDHDDIRRHAAHIAAAVRDPAATSDNGLRAALYGLGAIVHLHMATEEELFYPLLDLHLDDAAVFTLITAMQQSKHESRQAAELNESAGTATTPGSTPAS